VPDKRVPELLGQTSACYCQKIVVVAGRCETEDI